MLAPSDSAHVTSQSLGERWSKLVVNVMGNGLSACTGMVSKEIVADDTMRHFASRLGSEAIRVGQALGYTLEDILHMPPETIARAGEGDPEATRFVDEHRFAENGGGDHHPSMGQDMMKGRRTEN